ncbi:MULTISPECIES: oligosaccharide flippase family protein [Aeromonas]|uniref:oligosaccharide flippase family protein n=1 Tax=Aeromonas TaxID=642 RepID=UPI0012E033F5|nr:MULTISPECIES: polysaccharide biosynthesis C-terminal domain-containing protein [Aeromonas]MBL0666734.1 polysaccharide biosynthesis C-terminal domain-containing protein [Aeromonas jandaei]
MKIKNYYGVMLTFMAHLSKLLMGFFILKLIAYKMGVDGLGRIGNFMSLLTVCGILAGGGIINGVIKYTSEYRGDVKRLTLFVSSAIRYSLISSVIMLLIFIIFSETISKFIFGSGELYIYIVVLSISQVILALLNINLGVFNGIGKNVLYAKSQIIGSIIGIPICWLLINNMGFSGVIISLILSVLTPIIPAVYYSSKHGLYSLININLYDPKFTRNLSKFTLMLLVSVVSFPLTEIVIRQYIIHSINDGYHEVGLWQGALRLSAAYTSLISVVLAYWFMPIISQEENWYIIKRKVFGGMLITAFGVFLGLGVLYLFRGFFISTLLSKDFLKLCDILIYQLVGDFFKITASVFGFVAVAKAASRIYIFAELFQCSLILLVLYAKVYLSGAIDAENVMFSYALSYCIYFILSLFVFSFICNKMSR